MYSPAAPSRKRPAAAKNLQLSSVRSISNSMIETGLPTFSDSIAERCSMSPSMRRASSWRASLRSRVLAAHSGKARPAAATASSTSATSDAGAVPITRPVAGLMMSSVAPLRAGRHSLSMKFWSCMAASEGGTGERASSPVSERSARESGRIAPIRSSEPSVTMDSTPPPKGHHDHDQRRAGDRGCRPPVAALLPPLGRAAPRSP